jgi:hypothetical protein
MLFSSKKFGIVIKILYISTVKRLVMLNSIAQKIADYYWDVYKLDIHHGFETRFVHKGVGYTPRVEVESNDYLGMLQVYAIAHELGHFFQWYENDKVFDDLNYDKLYYFEIDAWKRSKEILEMFDVDYDNDEFWGFVDECLRTYNPELEQLKKVA